MISGFYTLHTPDVHEAVKNGNTAALATFLKNCSNINELGPLDMTLLHHAAAAGQVEVIQFLITSGANVDALSSRGTPFQIAVINGHPAAMTTLLNGGAQMEDQLHNAALYGHAEVIDLLVKLGAKFFTDYRGNTPLTIACERGHQNCIPLLQNAQKMSTPHRAASKTSTPVSTTYLPNWEIANWRYIYDSPAQALCIAARTGDGVRLKNLLKNHPNLIEQTDVLQEACLGRQFNIVDILVRKYKANVNTNNGHPYRTPLHAAVAGGDPTLIRLLIAQGADLHYKHNSDAHSAIDICFDNLIDRLRGKLNAEYIPVLECLLETGAELPKRIGNYHLSPCQFIETLEDDVQNISPLKQLRDIFRRRDASARSFP